MFPKSLRIKKSSDFKLLFTKGRSFHSPQLKLQVLYGGKPGQLHTEGNVGASIPTKYAVITPKGVGKAHDRNRIRRQLLAQLRAWHEGRYGKIGSSNQGKMHSIEEERVAVGSTAATSRLAGTAILVPTSQPIAMLAIYVKAPKDTSSKLLNLTNQLTELLAKLY